MNPVTQRLVLAIQGLLACPSGQYGSTDAYDLAVAEAELAIAAAAPVTIKHLPADDSEGGLL